MSLSVAGGPLPLSMAVATQRLLAYLLLHRCVPLPRKAVAFVLWPDATEADALANLRRHLHLLRVLLAPPGPACPWVVADRVAVQWNPAGDYWLDVAEFEALCQLPAASPHAKHLGEEVIDCERAVALYTDDLLVDAYDDWLLVERERLRQLLGRVLHRLIGLRGQAGDLHGAAATAEHLVRHDPLIEASHRLAMCFHYLAGDRGAALEAYQGCQRILAKELAVEPMPDTVRLADAICRAEQPEQVLGLMRADLPEGLDGAALAAGSARHNLRRRLTTFIGRHREMATVTGLLAEHRLVTFVGPAGCGKTRLALELAWVLVSDRFKPAAAGEVPPETARGPAFADGVWWVDCASIEDGHLVPQAVAAALGVRETPGADVAEQLEHELRTLALLLVLDNADHVLAGCADSAERWLGVAPALRVLATSREPLGVGGEVTWGVPPLSVPPAVTVTGADELLRYEAPRLFLDRARLCDPRFEIAGPDLRPVAAICRRLDGLPLAIELAAAHVRSLGVAQIETLLDDRFRLLVATGESRPARHASLRSAIDSSHDLLTGPEQALFRRLAVFRGGWDLAAARVVCGDSAVDVGDVPVVHASLVTKSFVTSSGVAGGRRYRMLETIRQYARDRLAASGEADAVRERHLTHFLGLAQCAAAELTGPRQAYWLACLDEERDNLEAALRWARDGDMAERGLRLAGALAHYWELRGQFSQGRRWLNQLLALPGAAVATAVRATALRAAGSLAEEQGDYITAGDDYRQALDISRQLGDDAAIAEALNDMGNVADFQGDYASARQLHEQALAIRRQLGDDRAVAVSLNNLGNVADFQGEYALANRLYLESLALLRGTGDRWAISVLLNNLGRLAMDEGELDVAHHHLAESLDTARDLGDRQGIAYALHNLGELARLRGDLVEAHRVQGESLSASVALGNSQGVAASVEALALVLHAQGLPDRAVSLLAAADAVRARIGAPVTANEQSKVRAALATLRRELGDRAFELAWAMGLAMSDAQAIALALEIAPVA